VTLNVVTHELLVDYTRPIGEQPDRCHNRWHPDIPAALTCEPGDEVVIQTRDAVDGQFTRVSSHQDVARIDRSIVHPLTGPIRIEGAGPGDVLCADVLDIATGPFGYTAQIPGFGFLSDEYPEPFLVRWDIGDDWATSEDIPGVRIPAGPFIGTIGVAPSKALLRDITSRERALADQVGGVALPDPQGAVPQVEPIASEGLRTKPPRENGGNLDVRRMIIGSRIMFPVWCDGALLSLGDVHFAQGDGESCGTAIETRATLRVRFELREGEAAERQLKDVSFEAPALAAPPRPTFTTTGLSVYASQGGQPNDLTAAARNALRNMIDHLQHEYGFSRQQAYALASVAVDLQIGEVVDSPNYVATATVPIDIFR
jgi:formamidase